MATRRPRPARDHRPAPANAPGSRGPRRKADPKKRDVAAPAVGNIARARAAVKGAGEPLPRELQRALQPSVPLDLSEVRVHADGEAGAAARDLRARAMTVDGRIAFAPGEFRPNETQGQRLIAHELAHVAQQRATPADRVQRQTDPDLEAHPPESWLRVTDEYASLTARLAAANLRDPTATRLQWNEDLRVRWARIGAPGEASVLELIAAAEYLRSYRQKIQAETAEAQRLWPVLQAQYAEESSLLAADTDVGPRASKFLDERYRDTARRVAAAGPDVVGEDLVPLQHMLTNGTHRQWVRDQQARQAREEKDAADRQRRGDLRLYELSETDLDSTIRRAEAGLSHTPGSGVEFDSTVFYLRYLQQELSVRQGKPYQEEAGAYPHEIARFSSYLIRGGYIQALAGLLPTQWAKLPEAELTVMLQKQFTEAQLREMFLDKYAERIDIKARFRKLNIVAALVTGLIWARENIERGEVWPAAAKIAGSGIAAHLFNKLLYARDKSAAELMAAKAGEYGRWFKGAARSNKYVDFMTRRLGGALLIWDLKDFLMSGGPNGPNIPFDLIVEIDIHDPSTWQEPSQTLLDLGFNIWYRQACTEASPEACYSDLYVGKVEGSLVMGALRFLGIGAQSDARSLDRLYRIEGDFDVTDLFIFSIVHRSVSADENVLVVGTGRKTGEQMSGRGHYHSYEVVPVNEAANELFGGPGPRFVPDYLLHLVREDD